MKLYKMTFFVLFFNLLVKADDTLQLFYARMQVTQGEAKVNEEFELSLAFKAFVNLPPTEIIFEIPKGIEYINGSLDTIINVLEGDSISIPIRLRIKQSGPYAIFAHIILDPQDTIYFTRHFVSKFYILSNSDSVSYSYKADENIEYNLVSESVIGSIPEEPEPLAQYTVSGYVKYKNINNNPPTLDSLEGIMVKLIKPNGQVQSIAYTNANGYYSITAPSGVYTLIIYAKNDAGEVEEYWRGDVEIRCIHIPIPPWIICWVDIDLDCSPGIHRFLTQQINLYSNLNINYTAYGEKADIARILWCIQRNKRWMQQKTGRTLNYVQVNYPPKIYIDMPPGFGDIVKYLWGNSFSIYLGTLQEAKIKIPFLGIWYGVGVTYNNPYQITLGKRGDIWDPDSGTVLTHEWSHGLQFSVLGNKIPYGEIIEDHWERTVSNHGHAFREGFAEFNELAMWIEEFGQNLTDTTKKREEFYQPLDTLYFPYYRGFKLDYPNTDGSIVEGSVMQFFWDLFDDKNTNDYSINFDDDGVYGGIYKVIYTLESLKNIMTEGVSIWEKKGEEEDSVKFKYKAYRFPGGNDDFIGKYKDKWQELGYGNVTELYYVDVHPFNYLEPYPVPAPTNFTGSVSENTCILSWSDNAQNEGAYILKRRKEGENIWQTFILPKNIGSYSDVGLEPNKTYYYKLAALTCDTSQWAGPIQVTTLALNPPTNLSANSYSPYNSVTLTWNDNSNYEEGYEIWRKGINENWHSIYTYPTQGQGTGQIQWTDNSVSQFKDYFYKVRAKSGNTYSNFSNQVWVTTSPKLAENAFIGLIPYNNRGIIYVNNKYHCVYQQGSYLYYASSQDGISWVSEQIPQTHWGWNPSIEYLNGKILIFFVNCDYELSYTYKEGNNWHLHTFGNILCTNISTIAYHDTVFIATEANFVGNPYYGSLLKMDKNGTLTPLCDIQGMYVSIGLDLKSGEGNPKGVFVTFYKDGAIHGIFYDFSPPHNIIQFNNLFPSAELCSQYINNIYVGTTGIRKWIEYDVSQGYQFKILWERSYSAGGGKPLEEYLFFIQNEDLFLSYKYGGNCEITCGGKYSVDFRIVQRGTALRKYVGMICERDGKIYFKEFILPLPVSPLFSVESGILLKDIPPNNSKRLFIKNDTLHILYSKNSLIYDAILRDSLIEKIFLGYGKNPACFLYKNNLYSIW
ncbi:MAG: fibronectin type III domain-containing protein, partial [candidate division WOR-3 bacterium]